MKVTNGGIAFDINECVNNAFTIISSLYYLETHNLEKNIEDWAKSCDVEKDIAEEVKKLGKEGIDNIKTGKTRKGIENFDRIRDIIVSETWEKVREVLEE